VRMDLPIYLSRPRKLEMTHTPAFGELVTKVRGAIEG
jgi:hypothetical protein